MYIYIYAYCLPACPAYSQDTHDYNTSFTGVAAIQYTYITGISFTGWPCFYVQSYKRILKAMRLYYT